MAPIVMKERPSLSDTVRDCFFNVEDDLWMAGVGIVAMLIPFLVPLIILYPSDTPKWKVNTLIQELKDTNLDVRSNAALSLGKAKDPRAVGPLIGVLNDKELKVRECAARALGDNLLVAGRGRRLWK